jgi:hypothetical protein
MVPLASLWLPILLSAVIVFLASFVLHMALPWHHADYAQVPDEEKARAALRPLGIPPGDYMVPHPTSREGMRSPEFMARVKEGPNMVVTVLPPGPVNMGRNLGLWFLYLLVVAVFAAYITGRALGPGTHYLVVFRFVGATAFMGFALALWQMTIWYRRSLGTTIRSTIDGLVYGLLMAGTFGWLWPK